MAKPKEQKQMYRYTVRVHDLTDPQLLYSRKVQWQDYELHSPHGDEGDFAAELAVTGFRSMQGTWVMPGAIMWIKRG